MEHDRVLPLTVSLPAIFNGPAAQGMRDVLLEVAGSSAHIVVDGSAVERVGTPALQVLIAASRTAAANGGTFSLTGPSEALRAALEDLGFSSTVMGPNEGRE